MTTNPARGMRDFLPGDVRRRQYVIGVIADVYQQYGFEPLETPAVENIETLLGKYGEEGDRLIFKILKRGEGAATGQVDLALRYDLTVPLARVVAEYRALLPKFFKRYQVQPVWRADRPQKGRFREFYQCDVDAVGSRSMVVEAELLGAACEVLRRLGFTDFRVRLNHRRLLQAFLAARSVPREAEADYLVAADKLDKVGSPGVTRELLEKGYPAGDVASWVHWLEQFGSASGPDALDSRVRLDTFAATFAGPADEQAPPAWRAEGLAAIGELLEIFKLAEAAGFGDRLRFDFGLVRGLSYYTGAIFEIAVPDLAGSLGGGGRYDNLIGMFLGQDVPACGISLGLERILVVMGERAMFPPELGTTPADVMVTIWNLHDVPASLGLAAGLRSDGLRVEVYPDADKIGKQFKYAASRGIPFVTVVGDDEAAAGVVTVKHLGTGQQQSVPRAEVAAAIRAGLGASGEGA